MKKDKTFIAVFSILFIAYVAVDFLSPKPISWAVTFRADDKNPFGGFILNDRSSDLFGNGFELSYKTLSELHETESNILIITEYAEIATTDLAKLFEILNDGGNVLIAATSFDSKFADTLNFDIHFEFQLLNQNIFEVAETTISMRDSTTYTYPSSLISSYFELDKTVEWEVLATSDANLVAITRKVGEGRLTLVSIPHIFTNFGMLVNDNYRASAKILSYLPEESVHYTMFYKSGRREATTPFRYFLREDALRWSLYLGLFLVALFLVISSRRKQRAIPVISPPENATVQYVKTLGALFFRERNHKKAALKLINHFFARLKASYFMQIDFTEKFYAHLAAKSNIELEKVIRTFELIQKIKSEPQIEEKILIDLSMKIDTFK